MDITYVETTNLDYDAQRLHDLGYKQEYKREVGLFMQAGFAFSAMAVLPNWMAGFGPSISAGGPSSLFWGWVLVSPFVLCTALSIAEIASTYPVESSFFCWPLYLSNKKWGPCKFDALKKLQSNPLTLTVFPQSHVLYYWLCLPCLFNHFLCHIGLHHYGFHYFYFKYSQLHTDRFSRSQCWHILRGHDCRYIIQLFGCEV